MEYFLGALNQKSPTTNNLLREIGVDADPALNVIPADPVSDLAKVYQMVSTYSTYLRFAVPFVSLSIFFVPLYIEPMIRSIREKLFNRGTLHVS